MKEWIAFVICIIYITMHQSNGINLIAVPRQYIRDIDTRAQLYKKYGLKPFRPLRPKKLQARRQGVDEMAGPKDNSMKEKIGSLIDQTINDAQKEFDSITTVRTRYNNTLEYKVGFLMYMVKRSRDVMNELFNVAVNHKEGWKALDHLKILELIIHTNVDSANLLRRLVAIATEEPPGPGPWVPHPEGPGPEAPWALRGRGGPVEGLRDALL